MTTRRDMLKSGAGLAAILATGKAPAAFIKSMLAARQIFLGRGGGAQPTAADYVQTGLQNQFDGIENVAAGQHDATTTQWLDLKTSGYFFNIAAAYADCVSFTGSNSVFYAPGALAGFSADHDLTLHAVITAPSSISFTTQAMIALGRDSFNKNGFVLGGLAGYANAQAFWASAYSGGTRYLVDTGKGVSSKFAYTVAFDYDSLQFEVYINGVKVGTTQTISADVWNLDGKTDVRLGMGANSGALNDASGFRMHSVMLYSRALTAEEIAHNYTVDKARFNLP